MKKLRLISEMLLIAVVNPFKFFEIIFGVKEHFKSAKNELELFNKDLELTLAALGEYIMTDDNYIETSQIRLNLLKNWMQDRGIKLESK